MFLKQINCRSECAQEWIKQRGRINVFPKILATYTFPDIGVNTLIIAL